MGVRTLGFLSLPATAAHPEKQDLDRGVEREQVKRASKITKESQTLEPREGRVGVLHHDIYSATFGSADTLATTTGENMYEAAVSVDFYRLPVCQGPSVGRP